MGVGLRSAGQLAARQSLAREQGGWQANPNAVLNIKTWRIAYHIWRRWLPVSKWCAMLGEGEAYWYLML